MSADTDSPVNPQSSAEGSRESGVEGITLWNCAGDYHWFCECALKAFEAAARIIENRYVEWGAAGGPNECAHGIAACIPCRRCDLAMVQRIIAAIENFKKPAALEAVSPTPESHESNPQTEGIGGLSSL